MHSDIVKAAFVTGGTSGFDGEIARVLSALGNCLPLATRGIGAGRALAGEPTIRANVAVEFLTSVEPAYRVTG